MNNENKIKLATLSQTRVNFLAARMCENIYDYYFESPSDFRWKKMRFCDSEYCRIGNLYILRSRNSIIAAFDIDDKVYYDFLRYILGYDAACVQYMSKFRNIVIDENLDAISYNNYSFVTWRKIK